MTVAPFVRLSILAIALAVAAPAMAQYQELAVEQGAEQPGADYAWSVRVTDGETVLAGDVPYLSVKEALRERAGEAAIDRMGLAEGAPRGFLIDAATAVEASALLSDGAVTYADGEWVVTGQLLADTDRATLDAILGKRTAAGEPWRVDVEEQPLEAAAVDPQPEMDDAELSAEAGEEDAPSAESQPEIGATAERVVEMLDEPDEGESGEALADETVAPVLTAEDDEQTALDLCREQAANYMADRSILFGSGSARLAAESEADLAGLAEIFAVCPSAPVYVEGHTDADGGAEANLVLSLSRAEAVVDALVDLGIDPQRLYAVGYGASLPIESNATAAGKAQNRRIVFSFEDAAGTEGGAE